MTKRFVKTNGRTVYHAALLCGLVLTLGLFLGACENPTSGGGNAAQEAADTFKSGQSGILDKTTDTVTLNDEAAVNAALAAYEELSAGAKELLTAEKAKLDSLKARIEELKATAGPEELAAAFKTGHSGVLNKTAETVTPTDEEAVEAALTAYAALNAGTKELLTAEKTKLDALKAKIGELKAVANAAAAFRADHAAVLGKTVTTVIRGDETAVNAALTAHEALSSGVKDLLTTEKAKLDALKVKIDELKLTVFDTVAALQTWLGNQESNNADSPYDVAYTGSETPVQIYDVLNTAGKFVALDLSAASVTGFATGTEPGRAKIVSLILPDSLTAIPDGTSSSFVFKGFTALKTISAANITTLGKYAFYQLTSLTTVNMPKVTVFDQYVFQGCTSLKTISLEQAVTMGSYAFRYCENLEVVDLNLPEVTTFGAGVFRGCPGIETLSLPNVTAITMTSLNYSPFKTINLPKVTDIPMFAFQDCTNLTTVILGATPPTIGNTIFLRCASDQKTITFRVPDVGVYTAAGSPWADKMGLNSAQGYFWDNTEATRDKLTVALAAIGE